MSKYTSDHRVIQELPKGPHPIWNTIGCLMIVIVPILSFFASLATIEVGKTSRWPIPVELLGYPRLPNFLFSTPGLSAIFTPIAATENLYAYIVFTLIYIVLIGGVIAFFYAVIYRLSGPSKYGPLDVPPIKRSAKFKRYKR